MRNTFFIQRPEFIIYLYKEQIDYLKSLPVPVDAAEQ
jgi:hypothetical protein